MKTFTTIENGPNRKKLIKSTFSTRKEGNRSVEFEIYWRDEEVNTGGTLKIKVEINEIAGISSSSEDLFLKGRADGLDVDGHYNPKDHRGYFDIPDTLISNNVKGVFRH